MEIKERRIKGVFEISLKPILDKRGFFMRTFDHSIFESKGLKRDWIQENHSRSEEKGIIRGLHFQSPPHSQGKLIQVLQGKILDVIVDIRKSSKTYGNHIKFELSAETQKQLWIPPGFAHGFLTLEDKTLFSYKCTNYYSKEHEMDLLWNDVDLDIRWGIENPIISEKDKNANSFKNFDSPF